MGMCVSPEVFIHGGHGGHGVFISSQEFSRIVRIGAARYLMVHGRHEVNGFGLRRHLIWADAHGICARKGAKGAKGESILNQHY